MNQFACPNFIRALQVEIRRSIDPHQFLLAVVLMFSWMVLSATEAVSSYNYAVELGGIYVFQVALDSHISTGPVILTISTIPYSFSYLIDHESGFQQEVTKRVGLNTYAVCKVIATGISAFLMGLTTMWCFVAMLSLSGIPHTVRYESVKLTYAALAATAGPIWYYLLKTFLISLVCTHSAIFALAIMAWVPNPYVGFLAPAIGYYFAECVISSVAPLFPHPYFWALVNPFALLFSQVSPNNCFSFFWTLTIVGGGVVFWGIQFVIRIRKKCSQ